MGKILITEQQLEYLTRFMIKEQSNKNPLLKLFYRHLNDSSKLYWDGTNSACRERNRRCLTEKDKKEMLESFARWINKSPYVKEKPNKRIGAIVITGKQEKEEIPQIIPTEPEEVCVPIFSSKIEVISDGQSQPFENNSTKLTSVLIEALNDVALIAADFKDEGKPVNIVDFTIRTSSNRYRNTGPYEDKSFSKLSQDRALAVQQYVQYKFSGLGITVPNAKINALGANKDGSSGPNPPKLNKVVYDEGETQKSYSGDDVEKHRGDFKDPHTTSQEYEQYKYAIVTIGLETTFIEEDEIPKEGVTGLGQISTPVEITNWKVRFYPKRKTKNKRTPPPTKKPTSKKIKINWSTDCGKKNEKKIRNKKERERGLMISN